MTHFQSQSASLTQSDVNTVTPPRIAYLDVAKAIGIFSVYLYHISLNYDNSPLSSFIYYFTLPLFFFISGCAEKISKPISTKDYIIKKARAILLPWFVFSLVGICIYSLSVSMTGSFLPSTILHLLKNVVCGCIRCQHVDQQLWFLTSLFSVSILFHFISKLKKWYLILASSMLFYYASLSMPVNTGIGTCYFWNLDSSCFYLSFYTIGYLTFPYIHNLFQRNSIATPILAIITLIFSAFIFYQRDPLTVFGSVFLFFPCTLIMCFHILIVSWYLADCRILQEFGKNTLFLCGSETMSGTIIHNLLWIFGLSIQINTMLSAMLYVFIQLCLVNKFLVPIWKAIIRSIEMHIEMIVKSLTFKQIRFE